MIESTYNLKRSPRYPQVRFLILRWVRMMVTHFHVLRRTRIFFFFTRSRMVISCVVEDDDLPRCQKLEKNLEGTCKGCPWLSGILVSPNNLGWGSRYFQQPGWYIPSTPTKWCCNWGNKVNFQIFKYQKLTSLHLDDVSGGVYWACPHYTWGWTNGSVYRAWDFIPFPRPSRSQVGSCRRVVNLKSNKSFWKNEVCYI